METQKSTEINKGGKKSEEKVNGGGFWREREREREREKPKNLVFKGTNCRTIVALQ